MHSNSLDAYAAVDVSARERQCLEALAKIGIFGGTDREIAVVAGLDICSTRPRLTGLVKKGLARECGSVIEAGSRHKVRYCIITAQGRAALERQAKEAGLIQ